MNGQKKQQKEEKLQAAQSLVGGGDGRVGESSEFESESEWSEDIDEPESAAADISSDSESDY